MGKTVIANGRSIIHKGHGATHVCAIPDVCKTPSPGGPVPIPYVNVAKDGDLSKGSKKVKIEGNPVAHKDSVLSTSTGDEAGTAGGGIVSSKTKGKMSWPSVSMDVKVEGKGVARFMDPTLHNGNSYNSTFMAMGKPCLAYGDDFDGPCAVCGEGPDKHRIQESESSVNRAKELVKAIQARKGEEGAGKLRGRMIGVLICKCGKVWAAISGSGKPHKLFKEVVEGLRGRWTACMKPNPGPADLIASNSYFSRPGLSNAAKKKSTKSLKSAWNKAQHNADKGSHGYNVPGMCAGTKLMVESAGHKPISMTEMFVPHSNSKKKCFTYYVREVKQNTKAETVLAKPSRISHGSKGHLTQFTFSGNGVEEPKSEAGGSVASCHTCQIVIGVACCDQGLKDC